MCYDKFERRTIKMGAGLPTIPVSTDHRNGDWIATDIYEGELYMDTNTGQTYTRSGSTIITAGKGAENFANADLTLTGTRLHDLDGNALLIADNPSAFSTEYFTLGGGVAEIGYGTSGSSNSVKIQSTAIDTYIGGVSKTVVTSNSIQLLDLVYMTALPTYANDAAAGAGGLAQNAIYKTATGELRIKL